MLLRRDAEAIKCECGGYAERVVTTPEENLQYGCHRDRPPFNFACCARAFVCCICKKRTGATADAPEMDY